MHKQEPQQHKWIHFTEVAVNNAAIATATYVEMVMCKVHCGSCSCTLSASSVILYNLNQLNHPFDFWKKCFKTFFRLLYHKLLFLRWSHVFVVDACAPTNFIQQLVQSVPSSCPQKSTGVKSLLRSKGPPQRLSWLLSTVQNQTLTVLGWLRKKEIWIILVFDCFRLTTLHFLMAKLLTYTR